MQKAPVKVVASAAAVGGGGGPGRGAPLQQNGNSNCSDVITTTPSSSSSPGGGGDGELMMALVDVVENNTTTTTTTTVSVLSSSVYPPPLATHQDVVASKELFLDTLDKFHNALGTRLHVIPKIGGKVLDLHLLYVEVTSRGGSQQVIKDRKWKELTVAFNFPHTTSSAAYVLRKYYIGILHHYEQVYFFRIQGPLVPPPRPSPLSATRAVTVQPLSEVGSDTVKTRKRKLLPIQALPDPSVSIGHVVTGAIEGKFEHGYLISIMMGTEKLRGVLYHLPPGQRGLQHADMPNCAGAFGAEPQVPSREIPIVKSSGRKHRKRKKDPNAPRANRSGYNFYFGEQHLKLKALHPNKERELSRMIGEAWNRLTDEEKLPYQEQAVKDKERFQKEMQEYQESLKIYDEVTPADSLPVHKLNGGKEESQLEESLDDIRDQQLEIMVAKLEEAFGDLPHDPNSSSAAVSDHEDSPLHDLPESTHVTPSTCKI
ncbi:unnamed protein product [Sphagnum tenellum]